MKLKNKISGEIKEFSLFDGKELQGGATLESLTKEWEDYEEPKVGYIIDPMGGYYLFADTLAYGEQGVKRAKELGIWAETKEEIKQLVEKLKAWKRLKDKGFRFTDYDYTTYNGKGCGQVFFNDAGDNINEIKADLDLLFGGEE